VNKDNAVKKLIRSVSAFKRILKKQQNRRSRELGVTTFIIPICGTSMICYLWGIKKPKEVSAMLIQYMLMKAMYVIR
jgi:hypothetical protein